MTDPWEDESYDQVDWTPRMCSDELTRLHTLLARAEVEMRRVRRDKKAAEYALKVARTKAAFSRGVPLPGTKTTIEGKDVRITVDMRNEWLERETQLEQLELMNAEITFDNGIEYMRRLDKQLGAVQSIQKNMLATYEHATGRGGR